MPRKFHIDIETYSSVDIKTSGVYKYVESPDFEILLIAYAFDDEPVKIVDCKRMGLNWPSELQHAFYDPKIEKHAHNANFERNAFRAYGIDVPIDQWHCSAVKSAYCGLPLSLEAVSEALQLGDKGKLATGKALIRYFCIPCKPTKANRQRTRNEPHHDPEKWEEFKRYCINDVEAEREINKRLAAYTLPDFERENYVLDQEINDRGILIDLGMAQNAVDIDARFSEVVVENVKQLTGIENPNSAAQLKAWLSNATGKDINTLAKAYVQELLSESAGAVSEVLEGRIMLAKSSTKKYLSMLNCACEDNRAHGLFQYYGANRTGRWAGRLIQMQNLPQNHMRDLELARGVIASGDFELATLLYDRIPTVLSELIRTTFIAPEGQTFAVSDFSAIEARVLSWLAGERWRLEVFKTHGKIYEASASKMFGVPIESVTKGSDLRQKGKIAELALGYQGGVNALKTMGGEAMGLTEPVMAEIVTKWRLANPAITKLWLDIEQHAKATIKTRIANTRVGLNGIIFRMEGDSLTIQLPSGRKLFYVSPRIAQNRFGRDGVKYMGMNQETKTWGWVETYGGKLVENIVQAISRDLLADAMRRLNADGFRIVLHVHDEVVCEVSESLGALRLDTMSRIMSEPVPWAKDLPLAADGYLTKFYKKE